MSRSSGTGIVAPRSRVLQPLSLNEDQKEAAASGPQSRRSGSVSAVPIPKSTTRKSSSSLEASALAAKKAQTKRTGHSSTVATDSSGRIRVLVRMRAMNALEVASGCEAVWRTAEERIEAIGSAARGYSFSLDRAFGPESTTLDVYTKGGVTQVVDSVMAGINGTVFAYGQTSSGKTHTMMGSTKGVASDSDQKGVIHLALDQIFHAIKHEKLREFMLEVSYLEIYNEQIKDLLNPASGKHNGLKISVDPELGAYVKGLGTVSICSKEQVFQALAEGMRHREMAKTKMNATSSRSHSIFRVKVESRLRGDEDSAVRVSALSIVDLAGSERAKKTDARGARLKEGGIINKSLLTLGIVIKKLSDASEAQHSDEHPKDDDSNDTHVACDGHIPYRDSKLTHILEPALGGNSRTVLICAVTPAHIHAEETISTLKFAQRTKNVKNKAHVNEIVDDKTQIRRLQKQVALLKSQMHAKARVSIAEISDSSSSLFSAKDGADAIGTGAILVDCQPLSDVPMAESCTADSTSNCDSNAMQIKEKYERMVSNLQTFMIGKEDASHLPLATVLPLTAEVSECKLAGATVAGRKRRRTVDGNVLSAKRRKLKDTRSIEADIGGGGVWNLEKEKLEWKLRQLENVVDALQSEMSGKDKDLMEMHSVITKHRSENRTLQLQLRETRKKLSAAQKANADSGNGSQLAAEKVFAAADSILLERLKLENESLQKMHRIQVAEVKEEFGILLEKRTEEWKKRLEAANAQCEAGKSQQRDLQSEMADLRTELESERRKNAVGENELMDELQSELMAAERSKLELKDTVNALKGGVHDLEVRLKQEQSRGTEENEALERCTQLETQLFAQNKECESRLSELNALVRALTQHCTAATTVGANGREAVHMLPTSGKIERMASASDLKRCALELSAKLKDSRVKMSALDRERESMQKVFGKTQRKLDAMESKYRSLLKECASLTQERNGWRKEQKQLTKAGKRLRKECSKAQSQLTDVRSLQRELQLCQRRLNAETKQHSKFEAMFEDCNAQREGLLKECHSMKAIVSQFEDCSNRVTHLTRENEILASQLQNERDSIVQFENELSKYIDLYEDKNAEWQTLSATHSEQTEKFERQTGICSDLQKKAQELNELKSTHKALATNYDSLEAVQNDTMRSLDQRIKECAETSRLLSETRTALSGVKEDREQLTQKHKVCVGERDTFKNSLQTMQIEVSEVKSDLVAITEQLKASSEECDRLKPVEAECQRLRDEMQAESERVSKEIEGLSGELSNLRAEKEAMNAELLRLQPFEGDCAQLQCAVAQLREMCEVQESELKRLSDCESQLGQTCAELRQLQLAKQSLENEKKGLEATHCRVKEECSEAQCRAQQLSLECARMNAEFEDERGRENQETLEMKQMVEELEAKYMAQSKWVEGAKKHIGRMEENVKRLSKANKEWAAEYKRVKEQKQKDVESKSKLFLKTCKEYHRSKAAEENERRWTNRRSIKVQTEETCLLFRKRDDL